MCARLRCCLSHIVYCVCHSTTLRASTFAYLRENHNSVLGMREYALEAGVFVLLFVVAQ